ncbi:uncharacterized protein [Chironomus tepperi]|uniref:uncharacterized protein n=1 Tax=Chironomus tepperi TaxID=113505 RepID=UPI00391F96C9
MDLLNALPEEIFNEIITYFNAKDVLKASLVSKRWYHMIGQSKACMRKISTKYTQFNCKNDVDPLLKSERRYQNLIIGFDHSRIKELGAEVNIRAILKKFSKSLCTIKTSHDFQRICELPNLKELKFKNFSFLRNRTRIHANYFCTNGLLSRSTNLRKLNIQCGEMNIKSQKIFIESLKNMEKLKSLTLNQLDILEHLHATDFKFKLEEINIFGFLFSFWYSIDTIYDFLRIHRSTLKIVRLDRLRFDDVVFFLSEFPKMHTFHFRQITSNPRNARLNIPVNTTLKKLIIACAVQSSEMRLKLSQIMVSCKNLKELKVHLLHLRFIDVLPACPLLNKVEYCFLSKFTTPNVKNYITNNRRIEFHSNPFSCT